MQKAAETMDLRFSARSLREKWGLSPTASQTRLP